MVAHRSPTFLPPGQAVETHALDGAGLERLTTDLGPAVDVDQEAGTQQPSPGSE
jgi:hypothetical protein